MLVEDEVLISMVLEDFLAEMDCAVLGPFAAVDPALDWLARSGVRPDGAILDVSLAGEGSYPVAAALRTLGVPYVFATGYGAVDHPDFAGDRVLKKPIDFDELAKVVEGFRR